MSLISVEVTGAVTKDGEVVPIEGVFDDIKNVFRSYKDIMKKYTLSLVEFLSELFLYHQKIYIQSVSDRSYLKSLDKISENYCKKRKIIGETLDKMEKYSQNKIETTELSRLMDLLSSIEIRFEQSIMLNSTEIDIEDIKAYRNEFFNITSNITYHVEFTAWFENLKTYVQNSIISTSSKREREKLLISAEKLGKSMDKYYGKKIKK